MSNEVVAENSEIVIENEIEQNKLHLSDDVTDEHSIAEQSTNGIEQNKLHSTDDGTDAHLINEQTTNGIERNISPSTDDVLDSHSLMQQTTNENNIDVVDDANVDKEETVQKFTRLPLSKIRNIMKFDDDVTAASKEAIFLATKATELFIGDFVKEVHQCTLASKKKTVAKRDVDAAIFNHDRFIFLDGTLS